MTDKIERNAHNALKLSMQLRKYPKRILNDEKIFEIGHFLKKNMGEKLTQLKCPICYVECATTCRGLSPQIVVGRCSFFYEISQVVRVVANTAV